MESKGNAVEHTQSKELNEVNSFDFKLLTEKDRLPEQFIWSSKDLVEGSSEKLNAPLIDLKAIKDDEAAMATAVELVRKGCMKHGFFEVTNHGMDPLLISAAHQQFDSIFNLPMTKKFSAKTSVWGYSSGHAERFSSDLPWKETFTYRYNYIPKSQSQVVDFLKSVLGEDFHHAGLVNQRYCEAMKEISMVILELLAISLGIDHSHFQRFFEDGEAIMRCNCYPPCNRSSLTLGVGPHCDPTSITILHHDQVPGLEVYVDDKWLAVPPRPEAPDAFIINIGDTFMALSNGVYKSCLHRVLVNGEVKRKTLTFFLNPRGNKIVRPPHDLYDNEEERKYPNFRWLELFEFTQKHHRADPNTLPDFVSWLRSSKPSN
ncbi:gibberellin 20 oxidase 3-like [Abrus precatorius]|uniref:Gibberellin 20 oxidase 3-like n=1 Tax=Abrus precatorius TaxID=3816 RepID=A0A8B8KH32_ABRPR|nr:gibberellin 20 oxidase 3-like [Abrus precatorius]